MSHGLRVKNTFGDFLISDEFPVVGLVDEAEVGGGIHSFCVDYHTIPFVAIKNGWGTIWNVIKDPTTQRVVRVDVVAEPFDDLCQIRVFADPRKEESKTYGLNIYSKNGEVLCSSSQRFINAQDLEDTSVFVRHGDLHMHTTYQKSSDTAPDLPKFKQDVTIGKPFVPTGQPTGRNYAHPFYYRSDFTTENTWLVINGLGGALFSRYAPTWTTYGYWNTVFRYVFGIQNSRVQIAISQHATKSYGSGSQAWERLFYDLVVGGLFITTTE